MFDPYEGFETAVMPNGLTVHVVHWPGRPWLAAGFVVHSGARVDPIGLEGTAHFVEHLVSRNGSVFYEDIKKFFKNVGGKVALGATGHHSTMYDFFVPTDGDVVSKAFFIFGEMLLGLQIKNFIEEQRRVILSEFHRKFTLPIDRDLAWKISKTVFHGTWLERYISTVGETDSIGRITQRDLENFYNAHYTPENMSVVCVGGMSLVDVLKLLASGPFGQQKQGSRTPLLERLSDFPPPLERKYVFEKHKHIQTKDRSETASFESALVIPGAIEWPELMVFGKMIDPILFDEVREKRGWTYSINFNRFGHRAFHAASIVCSGVPLKAIDQIEPLIDSLVQSMAERRDLFEQAVHDLISDIGQLDITGRSLRNVVMGDLSLNQTFTSSTDDRLRIRNVTMDDIERVLTWLVPHRRWTKIDLP